MQTLRKCPLAKFASQDEESVKQHGVSQVRALQEPQYRHEGGWGEIKREVKKVFPAINKAEWDL